MFSFHILAFFNEKFEINGTKMRVSERNCSFPKKYCPLWWQNHFMSITKTLLNTKKNVNVHKKHTEKKRKITKLFFDDKIP